MTQPPTVLDADLSALYNPQLLTSGDESLISQAKVAISQAGEGGVLMPETREKFQRSIEQILEISPNPPSTAAWVTQMLENGGLAEMYNDIIQACSFARTSGVGRPPKDSSSNNLSTSGSGAVGRSARFSTKIKSAGLCRITGEKTDLLQSCHIIPFSSKRKSKKIDSYCNLVKAMFGLEAFEVLLLNVMNGGKDTNRNINRLDNGLSLTPSCHSAWDAMRFSLSVDWATYDKDTGEFEAIFNWLDKPQSGILNCWGQPLDDSDGVQSWPAMKNYCRVPFALLPPSDGNTLPVPSAHLLYVRETLVRIAHIVGASEEYGDGYNDSDFESVDEVSSTSPDHNRLTPGSRNGESVISRWLGGVVATSNLSPNALALDLATSIVD